jgi:hypothetical protein
MYMCTCGDTAATEGDLMSHFIERHCLSYGIALICPLGSACLLTGGFPSPGNLQGPAALSPLSLYPAAVHPVTALAA